jgi:hypothetical protein
MLSKDQMAQVWVPLRKYIFNGHGDSIGDRFTQK